MQELIKLTQIHDVIPTDGAVVDDNIWWKKTKKINVLNMLKSFINSMRLHRQNPCHILQKSRLTPCP